MLLFSPVWSCSVLVFGTIVNLATVPLPFSSVSYSLSLSLSLYASTFIQSSACLHIPPDVLISYLSPQSPTAGLGQADWQTDEGAASAFPLRPIAHPGRSSPMRADLPSSPSWKNMGLAGKEKKRKRETVGGGRLTSRLRGRKGRKEGSCWGRKEGGREKRGLGVKGKFEKDSGRTASLRRKVKQIIKEM